MNAFLPTLPDLSVIVFAVTSMLSVGFGNTFRRILGPLRDPSKVARAVVANFVLVPALAYLTVRFIPLEPPRAVALFLIATAAGAPFVVKLVETAESDIPLSASLLVLLLPLTIVYMPIIVPLALPTAAVNPMAIATPLVMTMLLPLVIGLLVRAKFTRLARRLAPGMRTTSTVSLIVLIGATFLNNVRVVLNLFELWTILATVIVVGGAFGIGFLLGGPDWEAREVLGLGTGQRNIAAAMVVATQAVRNPQTIGMVVFVSLVSLAILFGLAGLLRDDDEAGA